MNLRSIILGGYEKLSPTYRSQRRSDRTVESIRRDVGYLLTIVSDKRQQEKMFNQIVDRISDLESRVDKIAIQQKEEIAPAVMEIKGWQRLALAADKMPEARGFIRDIQDISFKMLCEIDRICKKHKLEYWLDFGTLLGAVRHRGFVPWDDDMDISMLNTDYDKLLAVIDEELKTTDFRFIHVPSQIGKVVHKDFMPKGDDEVTRFINWDVHDKAMFALDISPYYYAKDTIPDSKLREYMTQATEEKLNSLFKGGAKYSNFHKSARVVDEVHKKITTSEPSSRLIMGLELLAIIMVTKPWFVDTNDVFPLTKVSFEGGVFPAPHNTEAYLIGAYGDYTQLPKDTHKHIPTDDIPVSELKKLRRAAKARAA